MTLVKICGITTAQDGLAALECGADMLGINFYPGSPRYVDLEAASAIVAALPAGANVIGVFVDAPADALLRHVNRLHLSAVQLHGDENAEIISALTARVPLIKAVRTRQDAEKVLECGCQLLLDAASSVRGGSGQISDWNLAREIASMTSRFYLAGGLTPANVGEAVRMVRPYSVDVASGVELSPGRKSRSALQAFVRAAKTGGPRG